MKMRWMILALVCCWPTLALSHAQEQLSVSPGQALQRLKDGNDRFAADKMEDKDLGAKKRQELAKGQRPFAIVLSCADSRVPPELIFNQGLGDLFVVRVAGNISDPFVVGSIDYGVAHLKVPLIVVLGHEACGAVSAAMGKDRPGGNLGKLLDEVYVGKDLPNDRAAALETRHQKQCSPAGRVAEPAQRYHQEPCGAKKGPSCLGRFSSEKRQGRMAQRKMIGRYTR